MATSTDRVRGSQPPTAKVTQPAATTSVAHIQFIAAGRSETGKSRLIALSIPPLARMIIVTVK
ncbi:hypothetical protein AB664_39275 [Brucella anthropi]|uniref:Uncharacterized protein n=1 Tax=Brucella anthropi TaxID=529 RepID=A0A656Z7W0_BRUAN|nr:hypothetical protein AB664_39275 [Brucella anthropi]